MQLHRILELVTTRPWLITSTAHASIVDFLHKRMADAPQRDAEGWCGEAVEVAQMEIRDEFAVIPINGVIARGTTPIERGQGVVDTEDIAEEIAYALNESAVESIILDVDSPGGMVQGTPELGALIADANSVKPVYAFTAGQMCSAAYWLACSSTGIFATPSADIGSIGVLLPFVDQVKRFEMLGYKVDVIKAGKYKGAGVPGSSLSEDQRKLLQDQVNEIYSDFTSHVRVHRGDIASDVMQGQTFSGKVASTNGLIDGFAKNVSEVMAFHREQKEKK